MSSRGQLAGVAESQDVSKPDTKRHTARICLILGDVWEPSFKHVGSQVVEMSWFLKMLNKRETSL